MTVKKKKTTKPRWKPTPGASLGPQETQIMDRVRTGQTMVLHLYAAISNVTIATVRAVKVPDRTMQQKIGGIVSRLNKKLKGRRVVVGTEPGTYRLRRVR